MLVTCIIFASKILLTSKKHHPRDHHGAERRNTKVAFCDRAQYSFPHTYCKIFQYGDIIPC
jgi:hypothetical protein